MRLLWLISRDDCGGLNYLCNSWRTEGEKGKKSDGREEQEKKFSTCIMSINKAPLKWLGRKGWNVSGGEESRVDLVGFSFFSFPKSHVIWQSCKILSRLYLGLQAMGKRSEREVAGPYQMQAPMGRFVVSLH